MHTSVSTVSSLLEALPYIQKYRGSIFVIKYGGSFMDSPDPAARRGVARDIVFLAAIGIKAVVVHGGGKAITRAMDKAGLKTEFVQGQRVTDESTAGIVDQVLSREINPEIVGSINSLGGQARGFAGPDVFTCTRTHVKSAAGEDVDIGYVGEVTDVDVKPILNCLDEGVIPVISPTARGKDGKVYNCNADVAAAHAAIALKARRLIFMSDVPGLLRDPKDYTSVISRLAVKEVEHLKGSGVIAKGMIPKVDSSVAAIEAGVEKVSFVDGRVQHSILVEVFTDAGFGTEVVKQL
jgi:acetylglutamate kinase